MLQTQNILSRPKIKSLSTSGSTCYLYRAHSLLSIELLTFYCGNEETCSDMGPRLSFVTVTRKEEEIQNNLPAIPGVGVNLLKTSTWTIDYNSSPNIKVIMAVINAFMNGGKWPVRMENLDRERRPVKII